MVTAPLVMPEVITGLSLLLLFVTLLVLQFFISAFNEDYQISEEIRNGLINQFLLKPINYFLYRFSIFLAARLVSGALILIPLLVAFPVIKDRDPGLGPRPMEPKPDVRGLSEDAVVDEVGDGGGRRLGLLAARHGHGDEQDGRETTHR